MTAASAATGPDEPAWLFTYGTLGPGWPAGRGHVWATDAVRGRLYDLGPYPGLCDLDAPDADWVMGHVRPVSEPELSERLDPYEGVGEGLFLRARVRTRAGRLAWVYVYAPPRPEWARGPLPFWDGPRPDLASAPEAPAARVWQGPSGPRPGV